MKKIDRYLRTIPKVYKPETNPVWQAVLQALAQMGERTVTQINEARDQLFIFRADGRFLNQAASSLGVSRPFSLGLSDEQYRQLVPNLSLKAKQVRKAFYDTADVFWGPLFSRANIETLNVAPFNISAGDEIQVIIDDGEIQSEKALAADIATGGAATADEIAAILNRMDGVVASVITDSVTGNKSVNLRTNTPGMRGSVEILTSSMVGSSKLNFEVKKHEILDLDQRVVVYELNPNELTIEIPAIVPALRRTLKGSHHFHADSTIESPVSPANGIWQGSFLFNPTASQGSYTLTGQSAELQQNIVKGEIVTAITVDDTSDIVNPSGDLIFDFGLESQEFPVKYRGVPNDRTILINPGHVFQKAHDSGGRVRVMNQRKAYEPRPDGTDLAIYLTSPSDARSVVEGILSSLAAAGVIVNFIILAPDYTYLIDNPYIDTDDAKSIP